MTTPALEQSRAALEKANAVRMARAKIKRRVRAGDVTVEAVLAERPACLSTMTIAELLRSQHQWGHRRTNKLLSSLFISPQRRVRDLTLRQRAEIAARLDGGGDEQP